MILKPMLYREQRPQPRQSQHDQTAAHHRSECKEGDRDWRPIRLREGGEPHLFGIQGHRRNKAAEDRYLELIAVELRVRIGEGNQDFARRLLVMPPRFDGGKLSGLFLMNIIAV